MKAPAFQFYVKDWLSDPQLRMTSLSTRGAWIDLLCYMWEAPERGKLEIENEEILGRMVGGNNGEIRTLLKEANALSFCDISVTNHGTITLCNRRMFRDEKDRKNNRLRQQRHRDKQKDNEEITAPSSTASPSAKKKHSVRFAPPTVQEVEDYCLQRNNEVDPKKWHNFYLAKDWMIGKNKMKDWKAAVRTWEGNSPKKDGWQ